MSNEERRAWSFTDDRGVVVSAAAVPRRIVAYVGAGAALHELGVTPVAVYGSGHDAGRARPDPVKSGSLPWTATRYLRAGEGRDGFAFDVLASLDPDLIVDLTYDGEHPYALPRDADSGRLITLDVGSKTELPSLLDRFGELAEALGVPPDAPWRTEGRERLRHAERALRDATAAAPALTAVALSPADREHAYVARPQAWPELRHLTGVGLRLTAPAPGEGGNWARLSWSEVAGLGAALVLADSRASAPPVESLADVPGWREITGRAHVVPWNPEQPPAPVSVAAQLTRIADAHRRAAAGAERSR